MGRGTRMRVINTRAGTCAVWSPGLRSPRYAMLAGCALASIVIFTIKALSKGGILVGLVLVLVFAITVATYPLYMAWHSSLTITEDRVIRGPPRKLSGGLRRTDVAAVRHRGEYTEFLGYDGRVLLKSSSLLTRRQAHEMADFLHVPFSDPVNRFVTAALVRIRGAGYASKAVPTAFTQNAPGVFVMRPDRGRTVRLCLVFMLFAGWLGAFATVRIVGGDYGSSVELIIMCAFCIIFPLRLYSADTIVVTNDAVYKGARNRSRFAARAEITEIVFGNGITLFAANHVTLLRFNNSLQSLAHAEELAAKLGLPLRMTGKQPKRRRGL